jgi:hypothetical protein
MFPVRQLTNGRHTYIVGVRSCFLNGVHVHYPAVLKSTSATAVRIAHKYPTARQKFMLRIGVTAPPIPNLGARWGRSWQWAPGILRDGTVDQSAPSGLEITNEWSCTSAPLKCLHGMHRDNISCNRWRRVGSFLPRRPDA